MKRMRRAKVQITVSAANAAGTGPKASLTVQWH
jgi:hypothetical protein